MAIRTPCSSITAINNVAAGSLNGGFCTYSYSCDTSGDTAPQRGNVAHSSRFGAWVFSHSSTCSKYAYFKVFKTVEVGLSLHGSSDKYMVSDVVAADNRVGIQVSVSRLQLINCCTAQGEGFQAVV